MLPLLEPKLLGKKNLRSWEQEAKNVPSGSLGVTVNGTIPFPPFDSWAHGFCLGENPFHILDADSKHIPLLKNPIPVLQAATVLIGTVAVSLKAHSIFQSGQLLQDSGEYGKTNGFQIVGPLTHFSDCEVS